MGASSPRVQNFQQALFRWFQANQRDLPWRHTQDPYKILVSEIMLQQTQVDRVMPKYRAFLRRFPTVRALARAAPREVLLAWEGMGYNRRALYLLRAAQEVVARHGGTVPTDPALLQTLPGVGEYTAAAVATFATGVPHALADTNVKRVIGRVFLGKTLSHAGSERALLRAVERTMPHTPVANTPPALWGHAVMDFGALVCKAKPRCDICPLQRWCKAYPQFQRLERKPLKRRRSLHPTPHTRHPRPIPDRIYRGNILQMLRDEDPRPVSFATLTRRFSTRSAGYLRRLLHGLAADGLLVVSADRQAVRLPG